MAEVSDECCDEFGCTRKRPYLIRRAPFSGRIVLLTDYTISIKDTLITARRKHDITAEFTAFALHEGWTPPPDETTP